MNEWNKTIIVNGELVLQLLTKIYNKETTNLLHQLDNMVRHFNTSKFYPLSAANMLTRVLYVKRFLREKDAEGKSNISKDTMT